ncbi:MAG: cytochrome D1 domain-containing protein [Pseudomonadales bacterium]
MHKTLSAIVLSVILVACGTSGLSPLRGTGDLGIIVERASGSVLIVDTSEHEVLHRVTGLGDLSHASAVFARDARYAFIFGRDGALTKLDLLTGQIAARNQHSGNSIGGAISQDGRHIAVSNYEPGGVRVFSSDKLELVKDFPATRKPDGGGSKTVGLVDAPGNRFVYSLFDTGEIWMVDMDTPSQIKKFTQVGRQPYDGLLTPDGRFYIAGLFGEDGMALLDLWHPEQGVQRILPGYGRGEEKLPVYKMPHLEGWAVAGRLAFVPAVGHHQVLVVDTNDWQQVDTIAVHGQPIFVMSQPGGRQVWVNFAYPRNRHIQVIDVESREVIHQFEAGDTALHMEFAPRGEEVWISVRDDNKVCIYDTETFDEKTCLKAEKPSGIFFSHRAHKIGL